MYKLIRKEKAKIVGAASNYTGPLIGVNRSCCSASKYAEENKGGSKVVNFKLMVPIKFCMEKEMGY